MADSDKPRDRAAGSGGTKRSSRRATPRRASARRERAQAETEVEPEKERLERLRSVLERKAKFG